MAPTLTSSQQSFNNRSAMVAGLLFLWLAQLYSTIGAAVNILAGCNQRWHQHTSTSCNSCSFLSTVNKRNGFFLSAGRITSTGTASFFFRWSMASFFSAFFRLLFVFFR
jgi:hypothetical protein